MISISSKSMLIFDISGFDFLNDKKSIYTFKFCTGIKISLKDIVGF